MLTLVGKTPDYSMPAGSFPTIGWAAGLGRIEGLRTPRPRRDAPALPTTSPNAPYQTLTQYRAHYHLK